MKAGGRLSRADRKENILSAMDASDRDIMTMYFVAGLIGISPSTHLNNLLQEMRDDGLLASWTEYYPYPSMQVKKRWFALTTRTPWRSLRELT